MTERGWLVANGQQVLSEYRPAAADASGEAAEQILPGRAGPSGQERMHTPAGSIGYQLLRMAGWREGRARGPGRPRRAPKRGWESVAVEEALPAKVARVKQVMQAEADDAAGKALARAVYRAFSDSNGPSAPDSNPLLRRNKLSASNPLP
ncbi:hypothetical protein WJX81_000450 [Elliptochloris bilobata]|uniref:G-patch domain-containing protein n=1 Tax=Elliptochloris bilobata TaxID=381761 RepID=A0AAW1S4H9_9CHLO